MFKAGASFHDKVAVVKMHVQRMPIDHISKAASLRVEQVEAIIKQFKDGKLKVNIPDRLQYEQEQAAADPAQAARIEELEQQNAELNSKLDMILARLSDGGAAKAEAPVRPSEIKVVQADATTDDEDGDSDQPDQAQRRQRRQRVANE